MNQEEMVYSIGLWFAKMMTETNADKFTQKLTNVTDKQGNSLGSFLLTVEKVKQS